MPVGSEIAPFIPIIFILSCFGYATLRLLVTTVRDARARHQIEESRREIAAYVAEGSISPEDARRLLEVDPPKAPLRS